MKDQCALCKYFIPRECHAIPPIVIVGYAERWAPVEPGDWCGSFTTGVAATAWDAATIEAGDSLTILTAFEILGA